MTPEKCAVIKTVLTWQAQFIKVRPLSKDKRGFICGKVQTIGLIFLSCFPFSFIVDIWNFRWVSSAFRRSAAHRCCHGLCRHISYVNIWTAMPGSWLVGKPPRTGSQTCGPAHSWMPLFTYSYLFFFVFLEWMQEYTPCSCRQTILTPRNPEGIFVRSEMACRIYKMWKRTCFRQVAALDDFCFTSPCFNHLPCPGPYGTKFHDCGPFTGVTLRPLP